MDFFEMLCFAKLYDAVMRGNGSHLTEKELDVACEVLKKAADQYQYWDKEQKEIYKAMVDYTKERTKRWMKETQR